MNANVNALQERHWNMTTDTITSTTERIPHGAPAINSDYIRVGQVVLQMCQELDDQASNFPKTYPLFDCDVVVKRRGNRVTVTIKRPDLYTSAWLRNTFREALGHDQRIPWSHDREHRDGITWHTVSYSFTLKRSKE